MWIVAEDKSDTNGTRCRYRDEWSADYGFKATSVVEVGAELIHGPYDVRTKSEKSPIWRLIGAGNNGRWSHFVHHFKSTTADVT